MTSDIKVSADAVDQSVLQVVTDLVQAKLKIQSLDVKGHIISDLVEHLDQQLRPYLVEDALTDAVVKPSTILPKSLNSKNTKAFNLRDERMEYYEEWKSTHPEEEYFTEYADFVIKKEGTDLSKLSGNELNRHRSVIRNDCIKLGIYQDLKLGRQKLIEKICDICDRKFDPRGFSRHYNSHQLDRDAIAERPAVVDGRVNCPGCSKSYAPRGFRRHVDIYHPQLVSQIWADPDEIIKLSELPKLQRIKKIKEEIKNLTWYSREDLARYFDVSTGIIASAIHYPDELLQEELDLERTKSSDNESANKVSKPTIEAIKDIEIENDGSSTSSNWIPKPTIEAIKDIEIENDSSSTSSNGIPEDITAKDLILDLLKKEPGLQKFEIVDTLKDHVNKSNIATTIHTMKSRLLITQVRGLYCLPGDEDKVTAKDNGPTTGSDKDKKSIKKRDYKIKLIHKKDVGDHILEYLAENGESSIDHIIAAIPNLRTSRLVSAEREIKQMVKFLVNAEFIISRETKDYPSVTLYRITSEEEFQRDCDNLPNSEKMLYETYIAGGVPA